MGRVEYVASVIQPRFVHTEGRISWSDRECEFVMTPQRFFAWIAVVFFDYCASLYCIVALFSFTFIDVKEMNIDTQTWRQACVSMLDEGRRRAENKPSQEIRVALSQSFLLTVIHNMVHHSSNLL